jgi:hypothetical protein
MEEISAKTGYDAAFLWARYHAILVEFDLGEHPVNADPLDVLRKRAEEKKWGQPDSVGKAPEIMQPLKQYICDPSANISCSRQGCVLMGGTCFTTPNAEFAASDRGLPEEATPRKVLEMNSMILSAQKNNADLEKFRTEMSSVRATPLFDAIDAKISIIDPETTKIRKHTHDTLWAVLAGFAACVILVVVLGLIFIAVLSYARG